MLKAELIKIKEREHLEKIEDIKGSERDRMGCSDTFLYVFMHTLCKRSQNGIFETAM